MGREVGVCLGGVLVQPRRQGAPQAVLEHPQASKLRPRRGSPPSRGSSAGAPPPPFAARRPAAGQAARGVGRPTAASRQIRPACAGAPGCCTPSPARGTRSPRGARRRPRRAARRGGCAPPTAPAWTATAPRPLSQHVADGREQAGLLGAGAQRGVEHPGQVALVAELPRSRAQAAVVEPACVPKDSLVLLHRLLVRAECSGARGGLRPVGTTARSSPASSACWASLAGSTRTSSAGVPSARRGSGDAGPPAGRPGADGPPPGAPVRAGTSRRRPRARGCPLERLVDRREVRPEEGVEKGELGSRRASAATSTVRLAAGDSPATLARTASARSPVRARRRPREPGDEERVARSPGPAIDVGVGAAPRLVLLGEDPDAGPATGRDARRRTPAARHLPEQQAHVMAGPGPPGGR